VARHFDDRLVKLLQYFADRVQHIEEISIQVRAVSRKRDIAWHVQRDVVTDTRNTDTCAFELGPQFAPFGRVYDLEAYRALLTVPQCLGAKHSSLSRPLEWQRLALRDALRPDFLLLTGNDLAIDMVMYGSDYLLGLSTFAPDLFARRDSWWEAGDPRFYPLNDALQYLGCFAFREPVPGYRHNAAQFLQLRGWIESDATHPRSPQRPESDREVLAEIARSLGVLAD